MKTRNHFGFIVAAFVVCGIARGAQENAAAPANSAPASATSSAQPPPSPPSAEDLAILTAAGRRDARTHDPSTIIKCKDEYWLFATGMGVISYHSKDLLTWTRGPAVFPQPPAWITEVVPEQKGHFWAPDVIHLGDRYLLYYSVSAFGKTTSAIALATTPTLDPDDPAYHWKDEGIVVQSHANDNFNTIDPSIVHDEDGKLWLAFGSFWSGIKLIELDPKTGKRIAPDSPMHALAWKEQIEASALKRHDGYYYLFVNWGWCCRGMKSTYNIRVGRSRTITGPYVDRDGVDMLQGGGSLFLDSKPPFIGPGHVGILEDGAKTWLSVHFYDGTNNGRPTLAIRPLVWGADGWPEALTN